MTGLRQPFWAMKRVAQQGGGTPSTSLKLPPNRPELPILGLHLCYFGFDIAAEPNLTHYKNRRIVILRKELFRASLKEHAVVQVTGEESMFVTRCRVK